MSTRNHLRADYFTDRMADRALCGEWGHGDYAHPEDVDCPACLAAPVPLTLAEWITDVTGVST